MKVLWILLIIVVLLVYGNWKEDKDNERKDN
jgi:hypothetical protein